MMKCGMIGRGEPVFLSHTRVRAAVQIILHETMTLEKYGIWLVNLKRKQRKLYWLCLDTSSTTVIALDWRNRLSNWKILRFWKRKVVFWQCRLKWEATQKSSEFWYAHILIIISFLFSPATQLPAVQYNYIPPVRFCHPSTQQHILTVWRRHSWGDTRMWFPLAKGSWWAEGGRFSHTQVLLNISLRARSVGPMGLNYSSSEPSLCAPASPLNFLMTKWGGSSTDELHNQYNAPSERSAYIDSYFHPPSKKFVFDKEGWCQRRFSWFHHCVSSAVKTVSCQREHTHPQMICVTYLSDTINENGVSCWFFNCCQKANLF